MVDDNGTHMNAKQPSRERILVNRDDDDKECSCIAGILALRKGTIFGDENNHGDLESISLLLENVRNNSRTLKKPVEVSIPFGAVQCVRGDYIRIHYVSDGAGRSYDYDGNIKGLEVFNVSGELLEEHVRNYFGGHYEFVEKQLDREATP